MCEDEGTRGGDVLTEAARCGIGGREEGGCSSGENEGR